MGGYILGHEGFRAAGRKRDHAFFSEAWESLVFKLFQHSSTVMYYKIYMCVRM